MNGKQEMKKASILWKLFITMLKISAVTVGGGFVMISIMKQKLEDEYGWLTEEEMLDYAVMAQTAPGSIAVNAAILVGWKVAGFWGMLASVLGIILPPLVFLSVISYCYALFADNRYVALFLKGMQAGVAAIIADVVISIGSGVVKKKDAVSIAAMVLAFVAVFAFRVSAMLLIAAGILLGVVRFFLSWRGRRNQEGGGV